MRQLPSDWTETFDVVWSQDAFYHNEEKGQILQEAYKVLKRGAILVFSDILAADNCSQLNVRSLLQRNRATGLGTQGMYTTLLQQAHFEVSKASAPLPSPSSVLQQCRFVLPCTRDFARLVF